MGKLSFWRGRGAGPAALAALGALACLGWTAPARAQVVARPRAEPPARPASDHLSDAQLEAAIRARLAQSKIGADKFQVHVQGGVATLDGKTDVVQHKGTATRLAKAAGAVTVRNRIQVSDAAKQRAAANLEEGRRRAQVSRGEARSEPRSAPRNDTTTPKAPPPVRPRPTTPASGNNTGGR